MVSQNIARLRLLSIRTNALNRSMTEITPYVRIYLSAIPSNVSTMSGTVDSCMDLVGYSCLNFQCLIYNNYTNSMQSMI